MNTHSIAIALLVFLTFVCICDGKRKSKSGTDSGAASSKKISTLANSFKSKPTYSISDYNFAKYITERPRNYHSMVMFTATGAQFQCGICHKTLHTMEEVAALYHGQYDFNSSSIDQRIAFFVIEVENARQTFNDMGFETVPRLYFLPPLSVDAPKSKLSNFEVDSRVMLEGRGRLLQEIESLSGVSIEVMVEPFPLVVGLGILAALVALFVSAAKGDLYGSILWYQSPRIWIVVSAICFAVGVSGSISCVIKGAPLYGMSRRTGAAEIFSMQGRDQYLAEGLVIVLMTVGSAIAAYVMKQSTKVRFPVVQHALVLLSMATWIVLLLYIFDLYRFKTAWYNVKDTFPPELSQWLFSSVKKTSSLAKRLYRVSEIWLLEAKDFTAFRKKFKALVWDYVVRVISSATTTGGSK
mmetsp:Transcript_25787/g.43026  ORF Transcript_25787/g.43026 Transcript_25787/m.43026 type:complete len:411 (+) Transcript_25787:66-1298(+)